MAGAAAAVTVTAVAGAAEAVAVAGAAEAVAGAAVPVAVAVAAVGECHHAIRTEDSRATSAPSSTSSSATTCPATYFNRLI